MSLRTSATRYARALLDVAVREADPVRIGEELGIIVDTVTANRELGQTLMSPKLPVATRVNVMKALAERGGLSQPLARLLAMLAERGRLELLPMLLEVYRERLLAHQNIVRASVTSAASLSGDTVKALERRLSTVTGKQVQLAADVDSSLIGGVVTRIGSTVYDGSVRTQLQKMKQQLIESA
jgi:F-type H+-transporting ATPase subunit delta